MSHGSQAGIIAPVHVFAIGNGLERFRCLDGLRGLLACYVMVSHMAPFAAVPDRLAWVPHLFSHGEAAVDVFFILSGMVIVRSLETYGGRAAPFLTARAARILPAFLVVFAVAIAVHTLPSGLSLMPWVGPDEPERLMWSERWPRTWLAHIAAHLTMTHGLFPDGVLPWVWISFLGAAWSLSTEWQFYLLALFAIPRLTLGFGRGTTGRADDWWRAAALLLAVAAAGTWWRDAAPPEWQFSRAFLPNKAHYFALGIASAAVLRDRSRLRYAAVLAAAVALCLAQGGGIGKTLPPLAWTLCLTVQARGTGVLAPVRRLLEWAPVLWLGAASYSIYLVNEPVQRLLGLVLAHAAQGDALAFTLLWIPLAIVLPVLAAWWLHIAVELPGQRWGRRSAQRRMAVQYSGERHSRGALAS